MEIRRRARRKLDRARPDAPLAPRPRQYGPRLSSGLAPVADLHKIWGVPLAARVGEKRGASGYVNGPT
jgi:hypothetical protein